MTLFIPDMAGRLFLLILLFDTFQYLKAKDPPQPSLTVIPAVIKERDSVQLNCQTPPSVSECYFKMEGQVEFTLPSPCQQTLTGTLLVRWTGQSSPADVKIQCQYSATGSQFRSIYSESSTVKIADLPQLTVSSTVIRETESVQLSCETPPSLPVSRCYFYTEGRDPKPSPCTQSLTGTELLSWAGQSSSAELKLRCFYTIETHYPSMHSGSVSVTILDPKPDITVNIDEDFNIICLIPGSVSPDTTCNLYVGEESQPSFTAKIMKRKATSASRQQFCQFTPKHSDLISRLQSVRRKEVTCDYRLSSGPNSLSPRSDGHSFAHLVGVHISDPTTIQTPSIAVSLTPGPRSTLPPSTTVSPTEVSTVTSTLTPDTTARPSTSLTSPLTPSTAVNPTSGGQSVTESVLVSTVTSTLTPDITVRPTSLTSPLAPSTAVNHTSDLTVSPTLTTDTPKSPTERGQSSTDSVVNSNSQKRVWVVQLWQTTVCMASGVGVFWMGLTAVCLCRRTKKTSSQRSTARQDDHSQYDLVMGAMSSAGMLDSRDAGIYSLITFVPSTFFHSENAGIYSLITSVPSTSVPPGPFEENGKSSENDNSDMYHVYNSIPDRPATSAQPDGFYSLLQTT
ncbi:mucin-2-like isoform X2 [Oncorhynchus nerka]|uniref:mucin-2-like isoform X2 n=1 Tax=Oncorhynchus nerka TaxID=8023 RepID=UPI0031B81657